MRSDILALALAIPLTAVPVLAEPLKLDDYETVYQRVLTKPGAVLLDAAGAGGGEPIRPFQPFYVFERRDGALAVGRSPSRDAEGWVRDDMTIPWKHNIVTSLTPPAGRERQLFFADRQPILDLMQDADVGRRLTAMRDAAEDGHGAAEGVVAVEPVTFVDITQRFYIMPILDFSQELHPVTYDDFLTLKVASVPLSDQADSGSVGEFDVGIVFAVDTTLSMSPFVEAAARSVQRIVADLEGSAFAGRVHFGAIGFRDNPQADPGIEYRVKEITPLSRDIQPQAAVEKILGTGFAEVSTRGVEEDSLAGVQAALEETDWDQHGKPFGARYIVLLTDAGPNPPGDPDSASEITPEVLARAAEEKGVAILTLHLRNPKATDQQLRAAEAAYRGLSRFEDRTYYYPVDGRDPSSVGDEAGRLAGVLIAAMGEAEAEAAGTGQAGADAATEDERFLGNAMRLRWLGARQGQQAPDVIEAWVSERAVESPSRVAFRPRLLMTRNELATMAELVDDFIRQGERIEDAAEAETFFAEMQETVLRLAQNPDRVVNPRAEGVGDALEFLEGLPYHSVILDLDRDRWAQSAIERRQVLDNLRPRLVQYKRWLKDDRIWVSLAPGDTSSQQVYSVPLDLLP